MLRTVIADGHTEEWGAALCSHSPRGLQQGQGHAQHGVPANRTKGLCPGPALLSARLRRFPQHPALGEQVGMQIAWHCLSPEVIQYLGHLTVAITDSQLSL